MNPAIDILNQAGQTWWNYAFHATWTSSLLVAIVLGMVRLGRRWPAQLQYAILLIALIKFAVPPMLDIPIGLFSRLGPVIPQTSGFLAVSDRAANPQLHDSLAWAIYSAWQALSWPGLLMLIHAAGCAVAAGWAVFRIAKLVRIVRQARPVTSGKWYELFSSLSGQLLPRRRVALLATTKPVPPMAFGLLRRSVIVPESTLRELSADEVRTVLAHELAHHRRADLWINYFQMLLGVVWWFNPLVRCLNDAIRRAREDCCDDLLLCRSLTTDGTYCDALLKIASNLGCSARLSAALAFARIHPLHRRIERIMDPRANRWSKMSWGAVALTLVMAVLVLPGLSSERAASPEGASESLALAEPPQTAAGTSEYSFVSEATQLPAYGQGQDQHVGGDFRQQIAVAQPRSDLLLRASQTAISWPTPQSGALMSSAAAWNRGYDDGSRGFAATVAASIPAGRSATWVATPLPAPEPNGRRAATSPPILAGDLQSGAPNSGHSQAQYAWPQSGFSFPAVATSWTPDESYLAGVVAESPQQLNEAIRSAVAAMLEDTKAPRYPFIPDDTASFESLVSPDVLLADALDTPLPSLTAEPAGPTDIGDANQEDRLAGMNSPGPLGSIVGGPDGLGLASSLAPIGVLDAVPDGLGMTGQIPVPEPMVAWPLAIGGLVLFRRRF